MAKLFDRVKMTVSGTPGTGNITLGAAVATYQSFAAAGVNDGDQVSYLAEDNAAVEVGTGTYTASGTILSRTSIKFSTNSNAAVSLTSNATVTLTALSADLGSGLPSGSLVPFAGSAAPTGYLLCYGQAVSRATYSALFAVIGTAWGAGDGSTTFNLPDLRGRAPYGLDNMGGTAASRVTSAKSGIAGTTLGAAGGEEAHTLIISEMPAHNHDPIQTGAGNGTFNLYTALATTPNSVAARTGTGNLTTQGSDQPHNNMPPTVMTNYIIKT